MQDIAASSQERIAPAGDAGNAPRAWERFQNLVTAAVDHFNRGSLRQAATLLELAEVWQEEQGFDRASVDRVRDRLGRELDGGRLRDAAEDGLDRPALRIVLHFFSTFACDALLDALRIEPRRERRRWLLLMLETHGAPAREAALARLSKPFAPVPDPDEWYFRRNLLHLMRRIPRPTDLPSEGEMEAAVRHARMGLPSLVVKEAIGLLGHIRDDRAEIALLRILEEVEDLMWSRDAYSETRNLPAIADRAAAALAGFPSPRARRTVVDYAERALLESGRPMAALAALGQFDLSDDERIVDRLVGLIRRSHPSSLVRRILLHGDEGHDQLVPLIESLAGTPLPVVRRTLERVIRRYADKSSGRAAARVLADLPGGERLAIH